MGTWLVLNTVALAILTLALLLVLQWMYSELIAQRQTIGRLSDEIGLLKGHANCKVAETDETRRSAEDMRSTVPLMSGNGSG